MFGIDILDAGFLTGLTIALAAGMISFISPCVLPIVPAYLAYISGMSFREFSESRQRRQIVLLALCFVLGLSVVFLLLGAAASTLGAYLLAHQILLARVAGIVIIIFGLHFLGVFSMPWLDREWRVNAEMAKGGSLIGAFVLGLAFAFGWTPCIGPILGAVLSLAAQEESVGRGSAQLMAYAVGLGLPFVLAAAFIDRATRAMNRIKDWMPIIEKGTGLLLFGVGVLLITGGFASVSYWLLETLPMLERVG